MASAARSASAPGSCIGGPRGRKDKVAVARRVGQRGQQHPAQIAERLHAGQRQRGLIGEQRQQRHVLLGTRPPLVAVEQADHPEHPPG